MHRPGNVHRLAVAEHHVARGNAAIEHLRQLVEDRRRGDKPAERTARLLKTCEELQAQFVTACERTRQVVHDDARR